ncbi:MAG: hypothetical protein HRT36_05345 [Alphaproteobacteria bacterium]|nr:hypothetical protein [Alphaproteobacteria bacterium]
MVDTGFNADDYVEKILPRLANEGEAAHFAAMTVPTAHGCMFVIGGVVGGYQFAHVTGYHAEIVIHNMLECRDVFE